MNTDDPSRPEPNRDDVAIVVEALRSLQRACRDGLVQAGIAETSARALGEALGLDKMLAWKLRSLATAEDAASATKFIPGRRGWLRLCAAFERHGQADPAGTILEAWTTLDAELRRRHLTLATLQPLMAAGLTESSASASRDARSSLSDAHASVWGVAASAVVHAWIVSPARGSDRLSVGRIKLFRGLHRTSPGPEWYLRHSIDGRRHTDAPDADRPEEADAPWQAVRCDDLISSSAEAAIRRTADDRRGIVTFDGRRTSPRQPIDLVLAEHASPVAHQHGRIPEERASFGAAIRVPTGLLVLDLLLDDRIPWTSLPEPTMVLHSAFLASSPEVRQLQDLPMTESPEPPVASPDDAALRLPDGLGAVDVMYRSAIERTRERMGADRSRLVLHRLVVPSPVLSTTVSLRWMMPPRQM